MSTTVELPEPPSRDPTTLTYIEQAGEEPIDVFQFQGVWLLRFAGDLTEEQKQAVRARAIGTVETDQLRKDVMDAGQPLTQVINSTGTLTTAQLSEAARAQAKALYALGRLVLKS